MISIADPQLGDSEKERVRQVLDDGALVAGDEVDAFESAFATRTDVDHAVATANGTAALHAALAALGIGEGDRVVTTPFSFVATANAIRFCNAEPVFADVDPETLNLDPAAVERVVEERNVDAILVVHLYGLPADMDAFRRIADEHDLLLVEDAAQAQGARYDGTPVGGIGDAGCFSFYPTKNMTTGEGGMVVTDDPDVARRVRQFVNHGRTDDYTHARLGHNFRMTNIAAAIGRVQLRKVALYVAQRRRNAERLTAALEGTPLTLPSHPTDSDHAFHQYTVQYEDREGLRAALAEADIDSRVYYPTPIHRQPAYDHVSVDLPVAERAADRVLSIPVHPGLTNLDVDRIAGAIRAFVAQTTADATPETVGRRNR